MPTLLAVSTRKGLWFYRSADRSTWEGEVQIIAALSGG